MGIRRPSAEGVGRIRLRRRDGEPKQQPIDPSTPLPPPATAAAPPENPNPNPNPNMNPTPAVLPVPPPPQPAFAPSFRPLVPPSAPQYSAIPTYQPAVPPTPGVQPPGVAPPGSMAAAPQYYAAPPLPRPPYAPMPNGYMPFAPPGQPAAVAPPGIPRYPAPYPTMVRPGFPMRPPAVVMPPLSRPPIPGIRAPPVIPPAIRPAVPIVAPTEKPQTTVYVGKIAPTVDNDFLLSLLRLCGPVKSWKRAQDPSDGTPKGFGFCEFEAAEGILRALRLLSKLNIDGQELVLNINQATREYLERYVEKKRERDIPKATEGENAEKVNEVGADGTKPVEEKAKKDADGSRDNENQDNTKKFGIVTDEDREADGDALQKITAMIEERLKNKPLPPPPPVQTQADASVKSNSEAPSRSRDGGSDVDIMKTDAEDKNDDETTSEVKLATEPEKPGTSSPDRGRRHDRRSRERDRERDREYELKREKERELERYERERERERVRRERDREQKMREAERMYKERVKEWEAREREREYQRQKERDREKDRERERWREILRQEEESDDDDTRKRRHRSSTYEDKRRKRQREKEEDLADRLKEEQEIAEAKKRATEEQPPIDYSKTFPSQVTNGNDKAPMQDEGLIAVGMEIAVDQATENDSSNGYSAGDGDQRNENSDEQTLGSAAGLDMKQNGSAPTRKLGFGLIGSGKRAAVLSVFHEEDDENVEEKKMRPLVPLDYSTEELQAVQTTVPEGQPNLVAAAEFAKRILVGSSKEKPDMERERSKQSSDRSRQRERERNYDGRDENKKTHDKGSDREREREDKPKAENKKLLDAKQLIDMIPKTKEELFGYEINWDVYDKHKLHERMRPWISKKINEFLGEEEETLVEYIVTSTKDHVEASQMLELLQSILDDEAEMFVLKMWRMLIFEIKKVETGLSVKPRP